MGSIILNHSQELKDFYTNSNRIIGIDMGKWKLGLAISNERKTISNPYLTYKRKSIEQDIIWLENICIQNNTKLLVIGIPIPHQIQYKYKTPWEKKIINFCKIFTSKIEKINVFLQDESCTTMQANEFIFLAQGRKKIKNKVDQIAASVILQHFLDDFYNKKRFINE